MYHVIHTKSFDLKIIGNCDQLSESVEIAAFYSKELCAFTEQLLSKILVTLHDVVLL